MKFDVFYQKEPKFWDPEPPQSLEDFEEKYEYVKSVDQFSSVDQVFWHMQGENWCPYGEARYMIRSLGLRHTSMSVGDLVRTSDGRIYLCAEIGWEEIELTVPDGNYNRMSILDYLDEELDEIIENDDEELKKMGINPNGLGVLFE
jgi:hypothetical protein